MKITVQIKQKQFTIHCGDGAQKIRWLADTAVHRYDSTCGLITGSAKGIKLDNGTLLDVKGIINENLQDGMCVYVVLQDDLEHLAELKKKELFKKAADKKSTSIKN